MARNNADEVIELATSSACTLRPAERMLLIALARLADWQSGIGRASQERIAAAIGVKPRHLRTLWAQLEANLPPGIILSHWKRLAPAGRLPNGYAIRAHRPYAEGPQALSIGATGPRILSLSGEAPESDPAGAEPYGPRHSPQRIIGVNDPPGQEPGAGARPPRGPRPKRDFRSRAQRTRDEHEARAFELADLAMRAKWGGEYLYDASDMLRSARDSRPLRIAAARLLRVRQGELDSYLSPKLQEILDRHMPKESK